MLTLNKLGLIIISRALNKPGLTVILLQGKINGYFAIIAIMTIINIIIIVIIIIIVTVDNDNSDNSNNLIITIPH